MHYEHQCLNISTRTNTGSPHSPAITYLYLCQTEKVPCQPPKSLIPRKRYRQPLIILERHTPICPLPAKPFPKEWHDDKST